jgi:hypothetical protein
VRLLRIIFGTEKSNGAAEKSFAPLFAAGVGNPGPLWFFMFINEGWLFVPKNVQILGRINENVKFSV